MILIANISRWYGKLVNRLSYRIDEEAVERYLALECASAPSLSELSPSLLRKIETMPSLNRIRYLNKYFISQNRLLEPGSDFVCWFHTSLYRKLDIFKRYPYGLSHLVYTVDFFWHRVCPKLPLLKKLYFGLTQGRFRVYPRPEVLGRLYCCGFTVLSEQYIGKRYCIVARKVREPFNDPYPSYGPIVRLQRVGKDGKLFNVYKLRTMHAYSEYLQGYVYECNGLRQGGKLANDYRVSSWGRILRKYWLDELPMFINLLKGDIKLVGVRPLSRHFYGLYSQELQQLRIQTKPGLLPPFYADITDTLEEVENSEIEYLMSHRKHPLLTDWKYFWMIVWTIVVKRARSK